MQPKKLLISRVAVSSLFFLNGFLYTNWTARLPELQDYFGVNNAQLGTILFCIALGSLVSMPATGWLSDRFGSDRILVIMSTFFCVAIPLVAASQQEWVIRLCFFGLGVTTGAMDVTMNGQAVLVERQWGKVIFSSFPRGFQHRYGAGCPVGRPYALYNISFAYQLVPLSALGIVLVGWVSYHLIQEVPEPVAASTAAASTDKLSAMKAILPFGIIAFCCMLGEGSITDWSAIYMHTIVGQTDVVSAWAFGVFGLAMTVGRLFGDYATAKIGMQKLMLIDALLATAGLGLVLGFATVWSAFVGLFLAGIGLSTIIPLVFSQAGNLRGITPSLGISMATSIGYTGFFVGPPVIGYLAEAFDLRIGLTFVLLLFVAMAVIIARQARRPKY